MTKNILADVSKQEKLWIKNNLTTRYVDAIKKLKKIAKKLKISVDNGLAL